MSQTTSRSSGDAAGGGRTLIMVLAWAWVIIPFLYGVVVLVTKLPALF